MAYILVDYSFRLYGTEEFDIEINKTMYDIELACNIYFAFEMIIKIISMGFIFE